MRLRQPCRLAPRQSLPRPPRPSAVPKSTHSPPIAAATSAKRSGNQRFAGPYSAPGQSPILAAPSQSARGSRARSRPPRPPPLTSARGRDNVPPDAAAGPFAPPWRTTWFRSQRRAMPGISDPARETRQPELERNPERIGKNNPDIESPLPLRSNRTASQSDFSPNEITASTSGTSRQMAAILAGASTVTCASGRPRLIARTAGMLMTLSPSQLLPRMRMRNGFRSFGAVVSGKKEPALVFLKEPIGARRFPAVVDPKPVFRRAPNFVRDHFVRLRGQRLAHCRQADHRPGERPSAICPGHRCRGRRRSGPRRSVCRGAPGKGEVEASRPKNGVQSP